MLKLRETKLIRDVQVIQIPTGVLHELKQDEQVEVTQEKGNSGTIKYAGKLYLITGENLDAIGREKITLQKLAKGASEEQILDFAWHALASCYDPEIPVDIVSLGLVYSVKIINMIDGTKHLHVKMTLTSPTCGIGDVIAKDAEFKLEQIADIDKVLVEIVLTPPWSKEMMSDEAKLELGIF